MPTLTHTESCTDIQDIYFVVDVTHSNDVIPFCQEMYALELLSEAFNPVTSLAGTRIGGYLYPKTANTPSSDMRYYKTGEYSCIGTVQTYHELMRAFSLNINNDVRDKVGGLVTRPGDVLSLIARDIDNEIKSGNAPRSRRRVVVTITDGNNDGTVNELKSAVESLQLAGDKTTLIAAGIATVIAVGDIEEFRAQLTMMAGGDERNAIVVEGSGLDLGEQIVNLMEKNGAICSGAG